MQQRTTFLSTLALLGLICLWAMPASAAAGGSDETTALLKARINLTQAIARARAEVPGKALSAELDAGHAPTVYQVEVWRQGRTYDVVLDSRSGKILETRVDTAADRDLADERDDRD